MSDKNKDVTILIYDWNTAGLKADAQVCPQSEEYDNSSFIRAFGQALAVRSAEIVVVATEEEEEGSQFHTALLSNFMKTNGYELLNKISIPNRNEIDVWRAEDSTEVPPGVYNENATPTTKYKRWLSVYIDCQRHREFAEMTARLGPIDRGAQTGFRTAKGSNTRKAYYFMYRFAGAGRVFRLVHVYLTRGRYADETRSSDEVATYRSYLDTTANFTEDTIQRIMFKSEALKGDISLSEIGNPENEITFLFGDFGSEIDKRLHFDAEKLSLSKEYREFPDNGALEVLKIIHNKGRKETEKMSMRDLYTLFYRLLQNDTFYKANKLLQGRDFLEGRGGYGPPDRVSWSYPLRTLDRTRIDINNVKSNIGWRNRILYRETNTGRIECIEYNNKDFPGIWNSFHLLTYGVYTISSSIPFSSAEKHIMEKLKADDIEVSSKFRKKIYKGLETEAAPLKLDLKEQGTKTGNFALTLKNALERTKDLPDDIDAAIQNIAAIEPQFNYRLFVETRNKYPTVLGPNARESDTKEYKDRRQEMAMFVLDKLGLKGEFEAYKERIKKESQKQNESKPGDQKQNTGDIKISTNITNERLIKALRNLAGRTSEDYKKTISNTDLKTAYQNAVGQGIPGDRESFKRALETLQIKNPEAIDDLRSKINTAMNPPQKSPGGKQ